MEETIASSEEATPIRVNFAPQLVSMVQSGEKFLTWRINDDKSIQAGDRLSLWIKGLGQDGEMVEGESPFGLARVVEVWEKPFSQFGDKEFTGHERFTSEEEMIEAYRKYYGPEVSKDTTVKIIRFALE